MKTISMRIGENMTAKSSPARKPTEQELVITRVFDAPRELVWKAWTEPEYFMRWWGPKGFTSPACKMDLRIGGRYLFCMRSPAGQDMWGTGVFREVVPPERLVMTASLADQEGNIVPASHYGMSGEDWPLETQITVTFEGYQGKTKLTLKHAGMPAGKNRDMAGGGYNQSFDKLAEYLRTL